MQKVLAVILRYAWIRESGTAVGTSPSHGPVCALLRSAAAMESEAPPCPDAPPSRLLASCGALSLASPRFVRSWLLLLRALRLLERLGQEYHPLVRAALTQPPADRTIQTHRKARHVSWALKKGTFPECLVCARQCAKWFICITSLKPH